MKKKIIVLAFLACLRIGYGQSPANTGISTHDLQFDTLAARWDEAIPLGNGMLGALIWQKAAHLRFSLDRADLWDLRPMAGLHRPEFSYQWVIDQVGKKEYKPVQEYLDAPYDREPAPSRIPGGALEFDTRDWSGVRSVHLFLQNALCRVQWNNGVILQTFVHAKEPVGWFRFEHLSGGITPQLIPPPYQGDVKVSGDPVGGDDLSRLGYAQGSIRQQGNSITYHQEGWGGFMYEINVQWKQIDATTIEGAWSISSRYPGQPTGIAAASTTQQALQRSYTHDLDSHIAWWYKFWSRSAIQVPDTLLEKQWYLEQYKFGSASRPGAPPISLQAVWTADNGRLPPWKGDFHHDLNTQLSYWPCYSANHLEEGLAYLDHLDANQVNYRRYTRQYFNRQGLAVPGVTTLDGTEMGGWIQYALSPTVSSWLGQHYYWQWRYSMDKYFLKERAYPWIKATATFLEDLTIKDQKGLRKLPISSSPEINDNSINAWFPDNTNYDLALMKFTFKAAAELAAELQLPGEEAHWCKIAAELGDFALSPNDELMFAPTLAYTQSHRHLSNMMAIFPLGLIQWEQGNKARSIIQHSIRLYDSVGPAGWCGYSYAWLASIKARAKDGAGAATDLNIFAKAFCSINSFHLNGDQTRSGYSSFRYRPFTLEGNFAFAEGLQEMLLQSYAGFIEIMPAIPAAWKDVSFTDLRAEGAFLLSAQKTNGAITEIKIVSEKGGKTRLKLPFTTWHTAMANGVTFNGRSGDDFIELTCQPGGILVLKTEPGKPI
jgi:alpha-L-fucosidase 2